MDWSNAAHVMQAIYWTLIVFLGLHGYSFGARGVI